MVRGTEAMMGAVGSVFDDLQAVAGAYQSYRDTGSLASWLSSQMQAFRGVAASVPTLRQQVANVRPIVAGSPAAVSRLDQASALLDRITAQYPNVNQRVSALVTTLLPILPQLQQGTVDAQVASVLAGQGLDIARTIHDATQLISDRDDAAAAIQDAVMHPELPVSVRDRAIQALRTATASEWWKPVLAIALGVVIIKAIWK
jgi:hypothetical protein